MFVSKKLNVMRTDTLNTKVEWCNEAFENADAIIYNDRIFYRSYVDSGNSSVYFTSILPLSTNVNINRLTIKYGTPSISTISKTINYS